MTKRETTENDGIGNFRPSSCNRCGSVGTIVDLGRCCEIIRMRDESERPRNPDDAEQNSRGN